MTGTSLVLHMLICGEDRAVGRGSLSSPHSAVPGLRGGGCSPLSAFPRRDDCLYYYPTPCPLPSCATSVVFQPKQHTSRLLFLSFGKTFLKRGKTQINQTALLDSVLSSGGCTISFLPLQKSLQGPSFPSFLVSALASPITSSALSQAAPSVLSTDWEPCSVLPFPVPSC